MRHCWKPILFGRGFHALLFLLTSSTFIISMMKFETHVECGVWVGTIQFSRVEQSGSSLGS